ncbi:MAG TPA: hydrogenase maturation nickel metallochaperone HypA [bacterium]|nr:hydrogenase maturation nickel metallochaperone HypA [bacterium]
MHEMSIANNIFDIAEQSLPETCPKLLSITVQIGELAGVELEALSFCFDAVKKSTPFPDAELIVERIPGAGMCDACGKELHIDQPFAVCPDCGNYTVRVVGGQELKVISLEIEEEET